MRLAVAGLAALLYMTHAGAAQADWRMYIIGNDADGYGIDRCLVSGAKCGVIAANAYCKAHDYAEAASFRKVDRGDITGAVADRESAACRGGKCSIVAIICTR